jgi:hypothetical protein
MALDGLPLDSKQRERLERVGLVTVEQLRELPRGALVWILGVQGQLIESLVRGEIPQLPEPEAPAECVEGSVDLEACNDREQLLRAMRPVLEQLWRQLVREGRAPKRLQATFEDSEGGAVEMQVRWRQPLSRLDLPSLRAHLERLQMNAPIARIQLSLTDIATLHHRDAFFWDEREKLLEGIPVQRVVWNDPECRLPERRAQRSDRQPLNLPRPIAVQNGSVEMAAGWIPIQSVLETFQVEWGWWSHQPISRSYSRVQLANGAQISLFRDQSGAWFRQYG